MVIKVVFSALSEDTFDNLMSWYTDILIRLEIEKNAYFIVLIKY